MNFKRMLFVVVALMALMGCEVNMNTPINSATPTPTPTANSLGN